MNKDPDRIINAITVEIRKLNEHDISEFSGDTLSKIGIRLAAYKAGLGEYVNASKKASWLAEKAFEEAKSNGYKRLREQGMTQKDAEFQRKLEASKEYQAMIDAKVVEDGMVGLSFNISDIIDAIKSRLIHAQMELKEQTSFGGS